VGDGDTLRVSAAGRALTLRLACIDAPEMAQSPWGQRSRTHLMRRLPRGREVTIEVHATDRYGRTVAEGISDQNINLGMVEDGQAFAYRRYLSTCDAWEYLQAEYRASRHHHGVWQVEGGIKRPWEFRRGGTRATPIATASGMGKRAHRWSGEQQVRPEHRTTDQDSMVLRILRTASTMMSG
jgi:endonuclease YncB( thermonuclease family)